MTEPTQCRYFMSPGVLWRWNGDMVHILKDASVDRTEWVESQPAVDLKRLLLAYEANRIFEILQIPEDNHGQA